MTVYQEIKFWIIFIVINSVVYGLGWLWISYKYNISFRDFMKQSYNNFKLQLLGQKPIRLKRGLSIEEIEKEIKEMRQNGK